MVLVIVGVLALAITISVASAGGERQLARESERLQALIAYACTRAELSGREIGVLLDANGYAFTTLAIDGWMAPEQEGELRQRTWVRGMRATIVRNGRETAIEDGADGLPQIVCFSSGELSPFVLRMQLGDSARHELRGLADGRVEFDPLAAPR